MALPQDGQLSVPTIRSAWYGAGRLPNSRIIDHEDGPIGIQDTSGGSEYQVWTVRYQNGRILITAPNQPVREVVDSEFVTDVAIAFSQNAHLHYVYTDNGTTYLYWYDSSIPDYTTTIIPDAFYPKMTLDDKRVSQSEYSDIILAYLKSDKKLYYRQQRDRFGIEYLLSDDQYDSLDKMYMNENYRLQFALLEPD